MLLSQPSPALGLDTLMDYKTCHPQSAWPMAGDNRSCCPATSGDPKLGKAAPSSEKEQEQHSALVACFVFESRHPSDKIRRLQKLLCLQLHGGQALFDWHGPTQMTHWEKQIKLVTPYASDPSCFTACLVHQERFMTAPEEADGSCMQVSVSCLVFKAHPPTGGNLVWQLPRTVLDLWNAGLTGAHFC